MSVEQPLFEYKYEGYAYSYPHKLAYRNFDPIISMQETWETEPKDSLFLYLHIPFCEMRCGFCNLFTIANPNENIVDTYLETLHLQATTVMNSIGKAHFSRMAVGGGTPTFLEMDQLKKLFSIIENGKSRFCEESAELISLIAAAHISTFFLSSALRSRTRNWV